MSSQILASGSQSPFDIPSIQRSITNAIATLPPDKLGQLVVDVRKDKASAALLLRVGSHVEAVAWVTKPYASTLDYGLQGRVSFLVGKPPDLVWFYRLRGWYRFYRMEWEGEPLNGPLQAAWKAVLSRCGVNCRLIG